MFFFSAFTFEVLYSNDIKIKYLSKKKRKKKIYLRSQVCLILREFFYIKCNHNVLDKITMHYSC